MEKTVDNVDNFVDRWIKQPVFWGKTLKKRLSFQDMGMKKEKNNVDNMYIVLG